MGFINFGDILGIKPKNMDYNTKKKQRWLCAYIDLTDCIYGAEQVVDNDRLLINDLFVSPKLSSSGKGEGDPAL